MKWISVDDAVPTGTGRYLVQVSGDSEHDDMGGVVYDFGPYVDLAGVVVDEGDGSVFIPSSFTDVSWDLILAWYGPIPDPPE